MSKLGFVFVYFLLLFSCAVNENNESEFSDAIEEESQLEKKISNESLNNIEIEYETVEIDEYWNNKTITSAKVFAYLPHVFNDSSGFNSPNIINENGEYSPHIIDRLTVDLNLDLIDEFQSLLIKKTNYRQEYATLCFEPHHGVVFYNKSQKIIGHLSICFRCDNYRLNPKQNYHMPMKTLQNLIIKSGVPMYGSEFFKKVKIKPIDSLLQEIP